MYTRVQFADEIEPLVQFIEETSPSEILDHTLAKLRSGVPIKTMLTASVLAVTRSSDLPPGHHGGPLHPLVGLHSPCAWRVSIGFSRSCSTSPSPISTFTTLPWDPMRS